jgi:hypothetical protein
MYAGLPTRLEHDLRGRYMTDICKGASRHRRRHPRFSRPSLFLPHPLLAYAFP